jgi:DNA-directed RNA polymerase subunit RPC12/RpoP
MNHNKCIRCSQFFKGGEEYLEISNNPKAGYYHKNCWAEVEAEQNNNYHTCEECDETIKAREEYAKETIPDAFNPHDVYYHKSCWEKKQDQERPLPGSPQWRDNNKCQKCGMLAVGGYCQICAVHGNNDNPERERERAKLSA